MSTTPNLSFRDLGINSFSIPENASEEEKKEIFRLSLEDSEKRNKKINESNQTPARIRQEYNYWDRLNISKEQVPFFMVGIFQSIFISTDEKDNFINIFCLNYLNDVNFQNQFDGKYLFFLNNKLVSIIDTKEDMDYSNPYDTRLVVKIGKLDVYNGYGKTSLAPIYSPIMSINNLPVTGNVIKSFNCQCFLSINSSLNDVISATKIIDSGADCSPLFDPSIWDIENNNFKNLDFSAYFFNFSEQVLYMTCNGPTVENFISLKNPLYVSLNGLKPVPIYYFNIPNGVNMSVPIIGMNILSQYTIIFGDFHGVYQCKIIEKGEEFWN